MDEFTPKHHEARASQHVSDNHDFHKDLLAHKWGPKHTTTTTATSQIGGKLA